MWMTIILYQLSPPHLYTFLQTFGRMSFLILCFQHEAKMKTTAVSIKEIESKKRILEEAVDTLNEDIAKLKAEGAVSPSLWH